MATFSLKTELRVRLLVDMIGIVKKKLVEGEFMVLVVDRRTSKILSSCSRMFDVMQTDVMIIENLTLCREKLDFHAIYFLENSTTSIKYLLKDYHPRKKPQYKAAHLFFTGRVSADHMKLIQSRKQLVSRIKTFKELNVDFLAFESQVYSFGNPCKTISNLYVHGPESNMPELKKASAQLISLCLTLKEDPYIRYWNGGEGNATGLCKSLATFFHDDFKEKKSQLEEKGEFEGWAANPNRSKGTILIVDRSIDPAAALMHEYTYQAMVNDLLVVNGELCTLPGKKKKAEEKQSEEQDEKQEGKTSTEEEDDKNIVVLSESDELWNQLRHKHFSEAMGTLAKQFKEFKETNKMAKYRGGKAKGQQQDLKNMVSAVQGLTQYKEQVAKFSKHQELLKFILGLFNSRKLKELGDLEQDMATGLTEEGDDVVVKKVKQELVGKCQSEEIAVIDKLRLLMIYMISQGGIQKGTLQELMKTIDNSLTAALDNLPKLGVDTEVNISKKTKLTEERKQEFKATSSRVEVILMRYAPVLQSVMMKLINWDLNREIYPYIEAPPKGTAKPKASKQQARWRPRNKQGKEKEDDRPLYIVFVLGGVTYSEMRLIYTIPQLHKAKIIIGSTDLLTPARFIRGLANLSQFEYVCGIKNSEGNAPPSADLSSTGGDSDAEDPGPEISADEPLQPPSAQEKPDEDCFSGLDKCLDNCCPWLDTCCPWMDKYL